MSLVYSNVFEARVQNGSMAAWDLASRRQKSWPRTWDGPWKQIWMEKSLALFYLAKPSKMGDLIGIAE